MSSDTTPGSFSRPRTVTPLIRATDRDRDAAIGVLQASYTEGRLTMAEHDTRVGQALAAQTYAELDTLTADLPLRPTYPDAPVPPAPSFPPLPRRTNGLAVASLICGLAQPFTGMLSTIPAIALGHVARGQIRRTGEEGRTMATWGVILGWAGVAAILMGLVAFILAVAFIVHPHGGFIHQLPNYHP
jgi:hypothetical protein